MGPNTAEKEWAARLYVGVGMSIDQVEARRHASDHPGRAVKR